MTKSIVVVPYPKRTQEKLPAMLICYGKLKPLFGGRIRYRLVTHVIRGHLPRRVVEVFGPVNELRLDDSGEVISLKTEEIFYGSHHLVGQVLLHQLNLDGIEPLPRTVIFPGETIRHEMRYRSDHLFHGAIVT
ncbi:MAG: hypothetical protein V1738_03835 [Patescibacteria group bacterium]